MKFEPDIRQAVEMPDDKRSAMDKRMATQAMKYVDPMLRSIAEIAARMDPDGMRELQAAGVIDSKFGAVTLLGLSDRGGDARPCLGFMKGFEQPNLRISGWSCQGDTLPARRAAIGCILDRLILLTAGNDPKLAELFAHAELKRGNCVPASAPASSADWVMGAQNPRLRGSL